MGRTYEAVSRKSKPRDFDTNFSGASVLGIISFEVGFYSKPLYEREYSNGYREKCTPFEANKEDCIKAGHSLLILPKESREKLYAECKPMIDMTYEEFSDFINDWATFLKNCGGYNVY
jgi:hypothetical protein